MDVRSLDPDKDGAAYYYTRCRYLAVTRETREAGRIVPLSNDTHLQLR